MNFANAIKNNESDFGYTENGGIKRTTTGDCLVDLFGVIGAMRSRSEEDITSMFRAAFNEDKLLATKMMFYTLNCRGGLGERRTGRVILRWMATNHPNIIKKNIDCIPFFNRWDTLYELVATPCEKAMWQLIRAQWLEDVANYKAKKSISIMAKWLASVNTSSEKTCALGRKTAKELGLTEKEYRKSLSRLRNYIKVCEKSMSKNEWTSIKYNEVPSYAMKRYKRAFARHDENGFEEYRRSLEKKINEGTITEKDIKSTVMYPMDLVHEYMASYANKNIECCGDACIKKYNTITEAQWKALPNYIEGENDIIVMADVSGSMTQNDNKAISASVGLAIYMAERNSGDYKNTFMTFTNKPHFITINENESLHDKIKKVLSTGVGYNTNLEKAFKEVLNVAIKNRIKPEDMPKAIVVISDNEIDGYCRGYGLDFTQSIKVLFRHNGYSMPNLVLWNVNARQNTYHANAKNPKVQMVSGYSASSFNDVLRAIGYNAYNAMVKTLSNPVYDRIKI